MSNQTTETIDKNSESSKPSTDSLYSKNRTRTRRKNDPPSWRELGSELFSKSQSSQFTSQTLSYIMGAVALGFGTSLIPFLGFSLPGGWLMAVFLVTAFGSLIGKDNKAAAATAGATVLGASAFFGGILVAIMSLGVTVAVWAAIGAFIGVLGSVVGEKIRE